MESSLPHLDRPFDYSVPADWTTQPSPACGSRSSSTARNSAAISWSGPRIRRRPHPGPAAQGGLAGACPHPGRAGTRRRVAARYAGTVSDVLRVAVPPRVARLEKEFAPAGRDPARCRSGPAGDARPASAALGGLPQRQCLPPPPRGGRIPARGPQRPAGLRPGGWPRLIAEAVAAVRPPAAAPWWWFPTTGTSTGWRRHWRSPARRRHRPADGRRRPTPRYRSYLRVLNGAARVAIGTRSAAYAPVRNLGLVVCWDDGDDLHIEQRAPYAHAREVLLLRAEQEGAACLMAAHTRSTEAAAPGGSRLGHARGSRTESSGARFRGSSILPTALNRNATPWPGSRGCPEPRGGPPRKAWNAGPSWSRWPGPATRRPWCARPAASRPAAVLPGAAGHRRSQRQSAVPQCRWCSTPAPDWRCAIAAARGFAKVPPESCGRRRNWAGLSPAKRS